MMEALPMSNDLQKTPCQVSSVELSPNEKRSQPVGWPILEFPKSSKVANSQHMTPQSMLKISLSSNMT